MNEIISCPGPFDPSSQDFRADPYRYYRWYQKHDPVHEAVALPGDARPRFFITRYHLIQEALRNPALSRPASPAIPDAPSVPPDERAFFDLIRHWVLFKDPPDHSRIRHRINFLMRDSEVDAFEPCIIKVAHQLLDELESRDSVDLVNEYAVPLVLAATCSWLGVGSLDPRWSREKSKALMEGLSVVKNLEKRKAAGRAALELSDAIRKIVSEAAPGANRSIDVLAGRIDGGGGGSLAPEEIVPQFILLLLAGHDNSSNLISSGAYCLLSQEAIMEQIRQMTRFPDSIIDEILRYESPVQITSRVATADVALGGRWIPKGSGVSLVIGAAQRDPEVFSNPDSFEIHRPAAPNLAFGAGIHSCPGWKLAWIQAHAALQILTSRFPKMESLDDQVKWRPLTNFRSLEAFRVRLKR